MPQKLKITILTTFLLVTGVFFVSSASVNALESRALKPVFAAKELGNGCVGQTASRCLKENKIVGRLNQVVNILSGLVGIVVVISLIIGGIQYTLAEDNPQKVGAARARILHALIALIMFAFIYAILQWLIPGGIFGP